MHYTAKLATDGTVVDTSVGKEPLKVPLAAGSCSADPPVGLR